MGKYELASVALSLVMIVLLPVHQILVQQFGSQDWLDMVIGLPIGMATVFNIDIIIHKIRPPKN